MIGSDETGSENSCGDRAVSFGPRLSFAGGTAISGLDLARPLSAEWRQRIAAAVRRHHIVIFRGQKLSREQQYAFAANFGEVEPSGASAGGKRRAVAHIITNLDGEGRPVDRSASPVSNYRWHTDKPYYEAPPMYTMLAAVELPPRGGDTEFANTALAYDALPPATKERLAGLRVVFRWGATARGSDRPAYPAGERPPVSHPLVRTHPQTGRRALYLGNHSSHIAGMAEDAGLALLAELLAHATQRPFVYAHRWRPGDLIMWDNCCLLHRVVANYDTGADRRILHRSVVKGGVPF
jgi:alpha-ketoglutarate-dependent taurine dioxygenase